MIESLLARADVPLSDDQRLAISDALDRFDEVDAARRSGYTGEEKQLTRILDELQAKRDFKRSFEQLLDDEQRGIVALPEIHDRLTADPLSPVNMAIGLAKRHSVENIEGLRQKLSKEVANKYSLSSDQVASLDGAFQEWSNAIAPHMEKTHKFKGGHIDAVLAAGTRAGAALRSHLGAPRSQRRSTDQDPSGEELGRADGEPVTTEPTFLGKAWSFGFAPSLFSCLPDALSLLRELTEERRK